MLMKKENSLSRLPPAQADSMLCALHLARQPAMHCIKAVIWLSAGLLLCGCKTQTARVVQPISSEVLIDSASSIWLKTISYTVVPMGNGLVQARAEIKNVDS